ncbi:MAG: NAD(P)/FAD-dependent oxidoreductase [Candidatus Aenigmarchaeota archaeon]|nr:NAD(P)/FAD-dependent oxidoreductase [Candidatus Aenigmarchaeota archaeon]
MDADVIVAGAGPSGSTCAAYLGKMGYRVLLLDKDSFPRDKACGDGIGLYAVEIFRELGLMEQLRSYKRIRGFLISSPKGTTVRIPLAETLTGYTCPREAFDNMLFSHARKFVDTKERFLVTGADFNPPAVTGKDLASGQTRRLTCHVLVAADGATSVIARKLDTSRVDEAHHAVALRAYYENVRGLTDDIELHFLSEAMPGYFWIFPLSTTKANVGIGMVTKYAIKNKVRLQDLMLATIRDNPLFAKRFANARLVSPIKGWNLPLASKRRKCYYENVLLVGDAAALVDPLTGEGIGEAMLSGKLAAQAIDEAFKKNDFSENTLKMYDSLIHKHLGNTYRKHYLAQQFFRHRTVFNAAVDISSVKYKTG